MNPFENSDLHYLKTCKALIEKKLSWSDSTTWKQRDFLNLISLIEKESGISLSLSTIKRLWSKDYGRTPQKSTLDALAVFIGFKDWLDFKSNHTNPKNIIAPTPKRGIPKRGKGVAVLILVVFGIVAVIPFRTQDQKTNFNKEVKFSLRNIVPSNVPNTVIFNYDVRAIEADSFFIQQSWNENELFKIDANDSVLTRTYFYPGSHEAKLIADGKVIAKTNLKIRTDDWIAVSKDHNKDVKPVYLDISPSAEKGSMTVDPNQLEKNQIPLHPDLILSYYYVNDFQNVDTNNYRVNFRIKNDSLLKTNCPKLHLGILGSKNACFVPLTIPGCVGEINLRVGTRFIEGRNTDLSSFGTDIFQWHDLQITKQDEAYVFELDNELIFTHQGNEDIGECLASAKPRLPQCINALGHDGLIGACRAKAEG